MLRYSKNLVVIAASLLLVSATTSPGLGVSITEQGAQNAKNVIMPFIFSFLQNLSIPEVDFDGGSLKNIEVQLPMPPVEEVSLTFDSANNGGEISCSKNTAHIAADFTFKYLFITANGQADITINKAGIDVEVDAGTQQSTPSYELAPSLKTQKLEISVNPDDIDITLTGGLVAKIANVLIPLLKSTVIPQVIDQVTTTAKTLIDTTANQDLQLYGSQEEIPFLAGVTADYAQLAGPQFTSKQVFQMGINGTFFDSNHVVAPVITPASFPLRDGNGKDAQLHLTDYTLKTALDASFSTGYELDITEILSKVNVTLTTDLLGQIIPEVLTKYGAGKAVGLKAKWEKAAPAVDFTTDHASFGGSGLLTFTIDSETALQAEWDDFFGRFNLHSDKGLVYGQVYNYTAGSIAASSFKTQLGMTSEQVQKTVQDFIDTNIEQLNANLTAGIEIPTILGINVSDVEIIFSMGLMELGMSLSPTSWLQITDVMSAWKQRKLAKMLAHQTSPLSMPPLDFIQ